MRTYRFESFDNIRGSTIAIFESGAGPVLTSVGIESFNWVTAKDMKLRFDGHHFIHPALIVVSG